jgi:hypothetical protein
MVSERSITVLEAVLFAVWVASTFPVEYEYLKYVDLGQLATHFKKFLVACIGWCVGAVVFWYLYELIPVAADDSLFSSMIKAIPDLVWFIVWTSYLTWSLRGQTLAFPKFSFKDWIVLNIVMAAAAGILLLSKEFVPNIVVLCIAIVLWSALEAYRNLIQTGKINYRLKKQLMDSLKASAEI